MDQGQFAILDAAIRKQVMLIEQIYNRVEKRKGAESAVELESLGYQLHNLYCAFEDLFKIVAEAFENHIEDASRYHTQLLWKMSLEIEGVRPALLSEEAVRMLDNLRSFRHFFRHAYSYELDRRKLKIVLEDALRLRGLYRLDVERFLNLCNPATNRSKGKNQC
ncbi:MAG: hypothetical protein H5U02_08540 [Clostridia bacterium]|nr:hypothetical protein [Clostridia bacterium]